MKNRIMKLIAFAAVIAVVLAGMTACEEEEPVVVEAESVSEQVEVANDGVLVVDGKRMEWTFSQKYAAGVSKGLVADESDYLEVDTVYCYSDPKKKYLAVKVYRVSNPGRYFYMMIDNVAEKVEFNHQCTVYDFKESNAAKYGYLYQWPLAYQLRNDFYMKLPDYRANGRPTRVYEHVGRLPNRIDINDLMEEDHDVYQQQLKSVHDFSGWDEMYFDAFLCGLKKGTDKDCDKTFAGYRYGTYNETLSCGWFNALGEEGVFHMQDGSDNGHRFFTVKRHYKNPLDKKYYDYVAFIGLQTLDRECYSIRYVFEPKYQ